MNKSKIQAIQNINKYKKIESKQYGQPSTTFLDRKDEVLQRMTQIAQPYDKLLQNKLMQIPAILLYNHQPSIFEAILEECSKKEIEVQEEAKREEEPMLHQQHQREQKVEQQENVWFWLVETPYQNLLEGDGNSQEDANLEFRRVTSLRQEQQTKIAQFLRDDKIKSMRCIEIPAKNQSPLGKYSQSLSPRKRKRIDKCKHIKVPQQTE